MSLAPHVLRLDPASAVPPFEQLRTQLARLVAEGELLPGTRLPTVRQLAADLGLAANTVARSYRELEADGVVVTGGRRGTFVHGRSWDADPDAGLGRLAQDLVTAARRAGLSAPETLRLVEQAWARPDSSGRL